MNKNHSFIRYFKQLHDFYGNNLYINNKNISCESCYLTSNKNQFFDYPFTQYSGQLFDKILNAMNLKIDDILKYNISNCFNFQSINLQNNKCQKYFSFFFKKIKQFNPRKNISLGKNSANKLLSKKLSMVGLRLKNWFWENINLIVTYNPLDLLMNQDLKIFVLKDFKTINNFLLD